MPLVTRKENDLSNITLDHVTGEYPIDCNGEYVVLYGKDLWIFKTNGAFVAHRPDIANPFKVAFLKGNHLLISGGKNAYHLISLADGSTVWNIQQKKREGQTSNFAVSRSGLFAYDYYYWLDKSFLVQLDLQSGKKEEFAITEGLRSTWGIICDENDIPCLLQCQTDGDRDRYICHQGVLCHNQSLTGGENTWKYKWSTVDKVRPAGFLNNVDTIITDHLTIYNPVNQHSYPLISEKEREYLSKKPFLMFRKDLSQRYLTLVYQTANVVIDCWDRKVVACYTTVGYTLGCPVGNEYWVCIDRKIVRKPFPLIEKDIFAIKSMPSFFYKKGDG